MLQIYKIITVNKAVIMLIAVFVFCITMLNQFSFNVISASQADYLNPDNWINMSGYTRLSRTTVDPEGTIHKANVTFDQIGEKGISITAKGYYMGGENNYSGLIFQEKMSFDNFSVTLGVKTLGAASADDDGWLGIAVLKNGNTMWNTISPDYNGAAVAILRPAGSRDINAYLHEIGQEGSVKYNNFISGGGSPGVCNFSIRPRTEGSIIRYSITKNALNQYIASIQQLDSNDRSVLFAKNFNFPLNKPEFYLDNEGKAFLALTSSTDNQNRQWEYSVLAINDVEIASSFEAESITPEQRATQILNSISDLKIDEFIMPKTTGSEITGVKFIPSYSGYYNPLTEGMLDKAISFSSLITGADNITLQIVADNHSTAGALFNTPTGIDYEKYKLYLSNCAELIIEEINKINAQNLIISLESSLIGLPLPEEINLNNEQDMRRIIETASANFNEILINQTAKDILTATPANDTSYLNRLEEIREIINPLTISLNAVAYDKFINLIETMPIENIEEMTIENAADFIEKLVPAEKLFTGFTEEQKYTARFGADELKYQKLVSVRTKVEELRGISSSNMVTIEEIENMANIKTDIFYLPQPAVFVHLDSVYDLLRRFNSLSENYKNKFTMQEKEFLKNSAISSLIEAIKTLPLPETLTADNYLNYFDEIENFSLYKIRLEIFNTEAVAEITNIAKLDNCLIRINVYGNPLSASSYETAAYYYTADKISIPLTALFKNDNYLAVTYTANVGEIADGIWTFTPSEAKNYAVTVTISNAEFMQTANKSFSINAIDKEVKKGCFATGNTGSMFLSIVGLTIFYVLRKKHKSEAKTNC